MTQSVFVQIGQCGNQIGCRFWDLALSEHAHYNKDGNFADSMSSFFRNVCNKTGREIDGNNRIQSLRARAVLLDMEEGVINNTLQGPLGDLFDSKQLITDVSGSGNNWATGHKEYGTKYHDSIVEAVRQAAERCDCLQCFFLIHSMGGGTGSGLGTYVLRLLADEYSDVFRFVTSVYPSLDDDVITSPYNTVLAMRCLTEYADCVIPAENQCLVRIANQMKDTINTGASSSISNTDLTAFDSMNEVIASMLLNLTSSSRFEGDLNVDLNEIVMNLVPYPRIHYLCTSQSPIYTVKNKKSLPLRRLDQTFTDAFSPSHQLIQSDQRKGLYMACALMVRGNLEISDIRRNIDRLSSKLNFIHWNPEGWKTGLCKLAPIGSPHSLLAVANNTCIKDTFNQVSNRFVKLYKRKAHLHHYTEVSGMELSEFDDSLESLTSVIKEYERLDTQTERPAEQIPRLKVPGF